LRIPNVLSFVRPSICLTASRQGGARRVFRMVPALALCAVALAAHALGAQEGGLLQELVLRPGDVIRVEIWREGDLSGDFHVDLEGRIVLPLLGEREVGSRVWEAIRRELMEGYGRELRNPSIRLTPLRRVHVLGEVTVPGLYAVDPTLSLAGAVAMAGGTNQYGDIRNIRVIRDGELILDRIPEESVLARVDVRSGDQVFVGRRSWIDRNSTFLVTALLSVTGIVVTLVTR
jgi:protein involved in polysaccharide export with SLBB domain